MPMANPRRNASEESIRVQEFTGGHNPREMMGDYDVNPNENADGLSHISQYGAASQETREQMDPEKRRIKALKEMEGDLQHISIKPEEMAETLKDIPMMNAESDLLESGMGVDMGHKTGMGISAGASVGPVRREGPGMIFGRSNDAFEDAWSLVKNGEDDEDLPRREEMMADMEQRSADEMEDRWAVDMTDEDRKKTTQGFMLHDLLELPNGGAIGPQANGFATGETIKPQQAAEAQQKIRDATPHPLGRWAEDSFKWFAPTPVGDLPDDWNKDIQASADPVFVSDIVKAKRKKKGRKYEEDEESEEDEIKSKKKHKRERRRKAKKGKQEASRQPKSKTARRAASTEQNLTRNTKQQAFAPRRMFSGNPRAKDMPLRLRDPVAYQRKLASEKFRREMGSLPAGQSAHADTRGITGEKVQTIGMSGRGTKLPSQGGSGTSFKKPKNAERDGVLVHDPLGGDALKMEKRARLEVHGSDISGFKLNELQSLKQQLKKLLTAVEKLTKSTPELGSEAKRGNQASEEKNTDPQGGTELMREEDKAAYRFEDTSIMPVAFAGGQKH